jgi:hypothetical protein
MMCIAIAFPWAKIDPLQAEFGTLSCCNRNPAATLAGRLLINRAARWSENYTTDGQKWHKLSPFQTAEKTHNDD